MQIEKKTENGSAQRVSGAIAAIAVNFEGCAGIAIDSDQRSVKKFSISFACFFLEIHQLRAFLTLALQNSDQYLQKYQIHHY